MKTVLRTIGCTLAAALMLTSATVQMPRAEAEQTSLETTTTGTSAPIVGDAFEKVISNTDFDLYYRNDTAETAVVDRRNGQTWYSNPVDKESDTIASTQDMNNLASQLIVYYFEDQSLATMDSFSQSVSLSQHTSRVENDALYVHYTIGEAGFSNDLLPLVISQERMEKDIFPKLSEEEADDIRSRYELYILEDMAADVRDVILSNFPILKKHSIYVRKSFPNYVGKRLYEYFQKAGYTLEDLQKDCDENGVKNAYKKPIIFEMELKYQLSDDGLQVTLDPTQIKYTPDYPLIRVDLLPYFGCGDSKETGYMLVPDGSGALINFNNQKKMASKYWVRLFGQDKAIDLWEKGTDTMTSVLPIFAVSKKNGAFLATIDEGYETAGVQADVAGKSNSYNYIGSFYDVTAYDVVSMSGKHTVDDTITVKSPEVFSGKIAVSYHFLPHTAAYDELAATYRRLLIDSGALKTDVKDETVLNLELTATARAKKSFLGIQYESLVALTSYEEAGKILDQLGVEHTQVKYTNAINGGKTQTKLDRIKLQGVLGNKKELASLQSKTDRLSMAAVLRTASSASKSISARALSKDAVKLYDYDFIGRTIRSKKNGRVLLSPSYLKMQAQKLTASLKKNNLDALHLMDAGYGLDSDFNLESVYDRHETRLAIEDFLKMASGQAAISAEYGSIFSLPYLSKIWNLPTTSSGFAIEDEAVPFYAMVVRGSVPYCTQPINESADARSAFLQSVEIGAQMQYSWIYRQAENPMDYTEDYYNRQYESSLTQAQTYAAEMAELLKNIGNSEMVGHVRHSSTLVESRFKSGSSGYTVYVNYGKTAQQINGQTIQPEDFLCVPTGNA